MARGVPAAIALLALSADMRCSCDVPGRPDMGDAGACYLLSKPMSHVHVLAGCSRVLAYWRY